METAGSVAARLANARESFEKQQHVLLSTLQSLQLFKIKFVKCAKERDAYLQKVTEQELERSKQWKEPSQSQQEQELEQLRQDIARAHEQSDDKATTLTQQLEASQSELEDLKRQLTVRSDEAHKLQEQENKYAQEIEAIRVEAAAQKSALESQISFLQEQTEQQQIKIAAKEHPNGAVNAHQEALESCKTRVVELQATVKTLEDDKISSQSKMSELMDTANSLRQQLKDAQTESESLAQRIKNQLQDEEALESSKARVVKLQATVKTLEDDKIGSQTKISELTEKITKLEANVAQTTAAHAKILSQHTNQSQDVEKLKAQLKEQENERAEETEAMRVFLESCKTRVVELQATVKTLEDDKISSQTKISELMDTANSLRQQLKDAQTESESLAQQVKKKDKKITKLEANVAQTTAAHAKILSQYTTLSKQQEDSVTQSMQTETKLKEAKERHAKAVQDLMSYETKINAYNELKSQFDNISQKHKDSAEKIEAKEYELEQQKGLRAKAVQELKAMEGKLNDMNKLKSRLKKLSHQHKDSVAQAKTLQKELEEANELNAKTLKELQELKENPSKSGISSTSKVLFMVIPIVLAVAGMYYFQLDGLFDSVNK